MAPGEMKTVEWRGLPVWVLRRTPEMLQSIKKVDGEVADPKSQRNPGELTPEYARNDHRSIKPEYLVVVGICSHLGCSPSDKLQSGAQPSLPDDWQGGFLCPCHGSTFDLAGRVYSGVRRTDATTFFSVSVARLRSVQVFVTGDVVAPGAYRVSSAGTALTALYAAGGPTDRGSLRIDARRAQRCLVSAKRP